jgi:hypothetical protein
MRNVVLLLLLLGLSTGTDFLHTHSRTEKRQEWYHVW